MASIARVLAAFSAPSAPASSCGAHQQIPQPAETADGTGINRPGRSCCPAKHSNAIASVGVRNVTIVQSVFSRMALRTDDGHGFSECRHDTVHVRDAADRQLVFQGEKLKTGPAGQNVHTARFQLLQVVQHR